MKKKKDVFGYFDFIPVSKEEKEKIEGQIKAEIPVRMFIIRGDKIYCGGEDTGGGGHQDERGV